MKAVVRDVYGGAEVLRVEEVDAPTPGRGEVLVRVHGSSVNQGDRYTLRGFPYLLRLMIGLFTPRARGLGLDVAGVVEAVGPEVTDWKAGDSVYGEIAFGQTWAELALAPQELLARAPASIPLAQAGTLPLAGQTALQAVREQGGVKPGDAVLVVGASGSVGSYAVQLARALGGEVTAVCSAASADSARALGARDVIDYRTEDYTTRKRAFDVLIDVSGTRTLAESLAVLKPRGTYVAVGFPITDPWLTPVLRPLWTLVRGLFAPQKVAVFVSNPSRELLDDLRELVDAGELTPTWASRCALDELPEAMAELDAGTRKSKLLVEVVPG